MLVLTFWACPRTSGRWVSNPRPKLGKLILKREDALIGGIFAFFGVPSNGSQLEQQDRRGCSPHTNLTGTNGANAQPRTGWHCIKERSPHEVELSWCNLPHHDRNLLLQFPAICCSLLCIGAVFIFLPNS